MDRQPYGEPRLASNVPERVRDGVSSSGSGGSLAETRTGVRRSQTSAAAGIPRAKQCGPGAQMQPLKWPRRRASSRWRPYSTELCDHIMALWARRTRRHTIVARADSLYDLSRGGHHDGRNHRQSHLNLLVVLAPLPRVPAPSLPGAARTSCPWHDTDRERWTTRHAPAPAGLAWYTGCRAQGGSEPRAGAYQVLQPGRGLAGSGLRPARPQAECEAPRPRRGAARHKLHVPVPGGPERNRGRAAPG